MAYNNALNLDITGVVTADGDGTWTASTVTQYGTVVAGATNTISSVAPSATSGVPFISQGSSADSAYGTAVVAGGGTGRATQTAYAVLCGGTTTTAAQQSVASVGTSGQVLTSNGAAALPTFQDAPTGITSAFNAYQGTTDANETGDSTRYILGDTDVGTALTERIDTGSDFVTGSSTGATYTAPFDGSLKLNYFILLQDVATNHALTLAIITSNEDYEYGDYGTGASGTGYISGNFPISWCMLTDMDAADICTFEVFCNYGSKVIDIFGSGTVPRTVVSGFLIP